MHISVDVHDVVCWGMYNIIVLLQITSIKTYINTTNYIKYAVTVCMYLHTLLQ